MGIDALRHGMAKRRAEEILEREWLRRGGPFALGLLGRPLEGVQDHPAGGFSRRHEFGGLRLRQLDRPVGTEFYIADIEVAAIRCFGTEDPGGVLKAAADEPYLIIAAVAPAVAFAGPAGGGVVRTWRTDRFQDITAGETFATDLQAFQGLAFGPSGIALKLVLMEHEHGDPDSLRKQIEERGSKIVKEFTDAAAALAGIDIGEALGEGALDSEILDFIGDLTVDGLTDLLQDDLIDAKTWKMEAGLLRQWADDPEAYVASRVHYPPGEIPGSVKTNFPREDVFNPVWLFSGGGGSYKVYLRVTPRKVTIG